MTLKINFLVLFSTAIVNLMAFMTGVGFGWPSPTLPKLNGKEDPEINPLGRPATLLEESWISGILAAGGIFGPIFAAYLADKIGRKNTILLICLPTVASLLMTAFAEIVPLFLVARFLLGLTCGSVYAVLPMYLVEIAEDHYRGALSSSIHPFITSGIVFTYAVGPHLTVQNFSFVLLAPVLVFAPLCFFINPESPNYLLSKNKEDKAKKELIRLRKGKEMEEVDHEILRAKKAIEELSKEKGGLITLLKNKILRKGLFISVTLVIIQQWSGIIAVISYMQAIFDAAHSGLSPNISSIIVGLIQVLATITTSSLVDIVGRKVLLLISAINLCISLTVLGIFFILKHQDFDVSSFSFLPLACLVLYIIAFNIGLGPVPWTVMAEMFPTNVKASAMMFNTVFCFVQTFAISFSFPSMAAFLGMHFTFWIFAAVCLAGAIFIFFLLPETKGKSLQEIQKDLEGHQN